jgi:hypothetical protein
MTIKNVYIIKNIRKYLLILTNYLTKLSEKLFIVRTLNNK